MTLEIVNESDVGKVGDKEKKTDLKPGLQLLDESDIKKVGSQEKKSWSDIVDKSEVSEVRKDPKIELVDTSDTRKAGRQAKKPELEFIAKERIIDCERQRSGMTNDCVLCKELSSDRFNRCPNKYGGY